MSILEKVKLFAALSGLTLFSVTVSAHDNHTAEDPMAAYYGGTWEYKDHEGFKHLNINKDMLMQIRLVDGRVFNGSWSVSGETVCFRVGDEQSCFDDLLGRKAGETWTGTHDDHSYTGILHENRETFAAPVNQ